MKQDHVTTTVILSLRLSASTNKLKPFRLHWKHFTTLHSHI